MTWKSAQVRIPRGWPPLNDSQTTGAQVPPELQLDWAVTYFGLPPKY
jgi:hypothetical protein